MISDDLRVQNKILIHLYENITKACDTSELELSVYSAGFEDINRQLYVLDRKGLLRFSETPPLFSELVTTLYVEITGEGCRYVEELLQQQENEEKKAQSWSF